MRASLIKETGPRSTCLALCTGSAKESRRDYVQAHMWLNLAGASGDAEAIKNRDFIGAQMTPWQIAEAQRMARDWKSRAPTPFR